MPMKQETAPEQTPDRTVYTTQQFKTNQRPYTGSNESGVLDESIRLPAKYFTTVHLRVGIRCS